MKNIRCNAIIIEYKTWTKFVIVIRKKLKTSTKNINKLKYVKDTYEWVREVPIEHRVGDVVIGVEVAW